MIALNYPLLADENIHPAVVAFLRMRGYDVQTVIEQGVIGQSDMQVLHTAYVAGRVVLTHDGDFGTLAIARGQPFIGIIYLRPGHIRPEFTIEALETIAAQHIDVDAPFIIVAERRGQVVYIRVRRAAWE